MTDDIVTRLQRFTCEELNCESDVICREAADEIERLRNEVKYLNQVADQLEEQVAFWITEAHKKKKWWCNRRG